MAETTIPTDQIRDGAITDVKVAAGADIATSKLHDGSLFVKSNGSVPFTADQSMGGNKLTNVADGVSGTDAATVSQMNAAIAALNALFDSKPSCKAGMTTNVTVSNPGTSTFDGVTLSANDRLLLTGQTATAENGIWIFHTAGSALTRALDMDAWAEVPGALVAVEAGGSVNANTIWLCTAASTGTINSTSITWMMLPTSPGLLITNFVTSEVPSGTINGSNATFTLANTPTSGTLQLFRNGIRQKASGNDYSLSGNTITMIVSPVTGDVLLADYMK